MNVNRSGYYKWLNRDKNQYQLDREDITIMASEIHKEHPSYGYHRIAAVIRNRTGWIISDNLVHKCCKHEGIKSKAKHYKYRKTGDTHDIYENIIDGDWSTNQPLEKITTDMTVIYHKGKKYEWTYVLDVYNDAIIASSISPTSGDPSSYYECRDQVLEIIKNEGVNIPVKFHSDQGTVYTSKAFNQALLDYNIERSMSRTGTPTDNAVIESMNGWIKEEIRCDFKINEWDGIEEFIEHFIHYYNYERPHSKLKYKSPAQFTIEQGFRVFF